MQVSPSKLRFTLFFSVVYIGLFAQFKSVSKTTLQKQMQFFAPQDKVKADIFFSQSAQRMGLGQNDDMVLQSELPGKNNYTYQKYKQVYQGVPVFGSAYTLRVQNGDVKRAGGYYLPMIDVSVKPDISSANALQIAMQKMQAKEYTWQDIGLAKIPAYAEKPEPTLVIIDASYPASSEYHKLAYQVDLQSTDPVDKKRYFIDAHTGRILLDLPLMMHQAVPSKGQTKYYGEQDITVDSVGPSQFLLLDSSRGNGNAVFDSEGQLYRSSENYWDLFNLEQDEVAIDAHYCTERFYDLMLNTFDWDGLDNKGASMNSIVHAGDFVNAFWDGVFASFGDGDCNHGPLTTLEVVAHEFMHGITGFTSDLIYSNESGAINESMSDIFGKALEFYEDPDHFKWTIGDSFLETQYAQPFRSFVEPNIFEHPKYYRGEFWSDFPWAVHINSSLGNHWFYLLVNGGEVVNEVGDTYDIPGIGMEKALQIVFLTQATLLTPNSNYAFYSDASVIAAAEIYGERSVEALAVQAAWAAVGVEGIIGTSEDVLKLSITTDIQLETCITNGFVEVEIQIVNTGSLPYSPDQQGVLEFEYENSDQEEFDRQIRLDQSILPGESIRYTLGDFVFIRNEEFMLVSTSLMSSNIDNFFFDSELIFITNSINPANDLELSMDLSSAISTLSACTDGEVTLDFTVANRACELIPAETPFELLFWADSQEPIRIESYSLPFDLLKDQSYSFSINLDLENEASKIQLIVLSQEDDPANFNNTVHPEFANLKVIDDKYTQTFNHDALDEIHINNPYESTALLPFNYQNENYFAAGGNNGIDDPTICLGLEEYFKTERVSMEMCIDTRYMTNPTLGFDLIQFRDDSEIEFQELINNTNVVRVSWTDGQNDFEEFISGQNEGALQNHIFELPMNARGVAKIEFYNKSGDTNFAESLLGNDVALLDNLTIDAEITNSVNSTQVVDFEIQPNPSRGLFQISYPDTPDALILTNIHGQEVLNISPKANTQEFDISHLPDGNYAITLIYPEGISSSILVKIGK